MEKEPNRFESILPEVIKKIIEEFEERFTTPNSIENISSEDIELIRNNNKIPITLGKKALVIRIGQDYRLTPDEIDVLIENIFEN